MAKRGTKQWKIEMQEQEIAQLRTWIGHLHKRIEGLQEERGALREAAEQDNRICQTCEDGNATIHLCPNCHKVTCRLCGEDVDRDEATCVACLQETEAKGSELSKAVVELMAAQTGQERRWAIERIENATGDVFS
jgi:hypothetical protein